ncbi:MAG: hypothetical protein ACXWL5_05145 [Candidatus Chromulinivorax sp.]
MKLCIRFFTITYLITSFSSESIASDSKNNSRSNSPAKFNVEENTLTTYNLIINPHRAFSPAKASSNSNSPFSSTKSRKVSKEEFQSPIASPRSNQNNSNLSSPIMVTGGVELKTHTKQAEEQALKVEYSRIFTDYVQNKKDLNITQKNQKEIRKLGALAFAATSGATYFANKQISASHKSPRIFGIDDAAASLLITKVLPTAICSVAIAYIYNDIKQAFSAQAQYETNLQNLHERLGRLENNYKDQLTTTTNLKDVNEKMQQLLSGKIIPKIENIQTLIQDEKEAQAAFEKWLNNTEIESVEPEKTNPNNSKKSNVNFWTWFVPKK